MTVNETDVEDSDQMIQASSQELEALTQHASDDENVENQEVNGRVDASQELKQQYLQGKPLPGFDAFVLERDGALHPVAFFNAAQGCELDEQFGRSDEADITVPSKTGKCGISRLAFRLKRSGAGVYSIISKNTVTFCIRGPNRRLHVDGYCETVGPE